MKGHFLEYDHWAQGTSNAAAVRNPTVRKGNFTSVALDRQDLIWVKKSQESQAKLGITDTQAKEMDRSTQAKLTILANIQ